MIRVQRTVSTSTCVLHAQMQSSEHEAEAGTVDDSSSHSACYFYNRGNNDHGVEENMITCLDHCRVYMDPCELFTCHPPETVILTIPDLSCITGLDI